MILLSKQSPEEKVLFGIGPDSPNQQMSNCHPHNLNYVYKYQNNYQKEVNVKFTISKLILFSVIFMFLSHNLLIGGTPDPVRVKIESLNAAINNAVIADDIEGMLVYFSDDVVWMPNYSVRSDGKEAVRIFMQASKDMGISTDSYTTITLEVWDYGTHVVELGTYTVKFTMPTVAAIAANVLCDEGAYMTVWQNTGDSYLLKTRIWNTGVDPTTL
jgi:ketosteroid isomerase-like protein